MSFTRTVVLTIAISLVVSISINLIMLLNSERVFRLYERNSMLPTSLAEINFENNKLTTTSKSSKEIVVEKSKNSYTIKTLYDVGDVVVFKYYASKTEKSVKILKVSFSVEVSNDSRIELSFVRYTAIDFKTGNIESFSEDDIVKKDN